MTLKQLRSHPPPNRKLISKPSGCFVSRLCKYPVLVHGSNPHWQIHDDPSHGKGFQAVRLFFHGADVPLQVEIRACHLTCAFAKQLNLSTKQSTNTSLLRRCVGPWDSVYTRVARTIVPEYGLRSRTSQGYVAAFPVVFFSRGKTLRDEHSPELSRYAHEVISCEPGYGQGSS